MQDLTRIRQGIKTIILPKGISDITPKEYQQFSYPKFLKLMEFQTYLYQVDGFGYVTMLQTHTKMGMELLTCSFTPSEGLNVPYLLIDCMATKKKATVFTEFYDCTDKPSPHPELTRIYDKYVTAVEDYQEKDAWYVGERTNYSLIKQCPADDEISFVGIVYDTVIAYHQEITNAGFNPNNLAKLRHLRHRMITEGNPATGILQRIFGKEGAVAYYRKCIMPIDAGERNRI